MNGPRGFCIQVQFMVIKYQEAFVWTYVLPFAMSVWWHEHKKVKYLCTIDMDLYFTSEKIVHYYGVQ